MSAERAGAERPALPVALDADDTSPPVDALRVRTARADGGHMFGPGTW